MFYFIVKYMGVARVLHLFIKLPCSLFCGRNHFVDKPGDRSRYHTNVFRTSRRASSTIERDGHALFWGQARPSKIEESNS